CSATQHIVRYLPLECFDLSKTQFISSKITEDFEEVQAVELMLVNALVEANDYLGISLHAHDPEDFWKLEIHKPLKVISHRFRKFIVVALLIGHRHGQPFCSWHIVNGVSNNILNHIILENNENKPITNNCDTQE
ncbi:hypothetical protein ACJX0J_025367, partial [Zea mays]